MDRDFRAWCQDLDALAGGVVRRAGLLTQPDSRAFGAHVEQAIRDAWPVVTATLGCRPQPTPGRRSICDLACSSSAGTFIGLDIKTKDLADGRYSDGGVCSVGNLLRWYRERTSTFVVSEFGYRSDRTGVSFEYVISAPFHVLPADLYRIENLGTGQVRLNDSLAKAQKRFDWNRSVESFLELFCRIGAAHYERVGADALKRAQALETYVSSGFNELRLR